MSINHDNFLTKRFFQSGYRHRVRRYLGDMSGRELLEIGAGYGHFAKVALQERAAAVEVIEPRQECRAALAALGIEKIHTSTLESFPGGKKYDVCAAITVLDEVEDKANFLRHVKNRLKPSGVALIEVRNLAYLQTLKKTPLATDVPEATYLALFRQAGLVVRKKGGAPRPVSLGDVPVFLKTLLANVLSLALPFYEKQMLIFVLQPADT